MSFLPLSTDQAPRLASNQSPQPDFVIHNGLGKLDGAEEVFLTTELPAAIENLQKIIPLIVFTRDHQQTHYREKGGMSGLIDELYKIHQRFLLFLDEPNFIRRFTQQFDPILIQLEKIVRTNRINELAPKKMEWGVTNSLLETQQLQLAEPDDNLWLNAFKGYLNMGKLQGGRAPLLQDFEAVDLLTKIYQYKNEK